MKKMADTILSPKGLGSCSPRKFNKLMSVFHAHVLLFIDHEFCQNIVKVAVDSRGNSQVYPQTTLTML